MAKTINLTNAKDSAKFEGIALNGFVVTATVKAITGSFSAKPVDTSKIMLKISLVDRPGQQDIVLANETLRDLIKFSHLNGGEVEFVIQNAAYGILIESSSPDKMMIPLKFNIGGVVDLRNGQGKIIVEWTVQSSVFHAQVDTSASYFRIDAIEVDDAEYDIPVTKSQLITADQDKPRIDMGNNVREISVFNHDKNNQYESSAPLISFDLTANNYKRKDDYLELINKNVALYPTANAAVTRNQNFDIYKSEQDLDGVLFEPVFNAANVATGQNIVMWRYFIRTDYHVTRGALTDAKKERRMMSKGMFNEGIAKTL